MFKVTLEYEFKELTTTENTRSSMARLQGWKTRTANALRHEPGPVVYPIQWTSERQRRAFFATDGFGKGIPYRRTGKLAAAWIVELNTNGVKSYNDWLRKQYRYLAEIGEPRKGTLRQSPAAPPPIVIVTIDNPASAERYVTGFQQQGFHRNTGWIYAPTIIENAVQEVETILGDSFLGV